MQNTSSIQITGDVLLFRVSEGMANSTATIDGQVSNAQLFGLPGSDSLDGTSTVTMGSLKRDVLVKGNLPGTIDIFGAAAPDGSILAETR